MPPFDDTHAHLDRAEFAGDFLQVLERARAAGVSRIITVGTSLASSQNALDLCARHPGLFAAIGWHPTDVLEAPDDIRPALRELARRPRVVAIGEIGLDHYRRPSAAAGRTTAADDRYRSKQADLFQQQLEVAVETGLPCIIHQRNALEATLAQFAPFAGRTRGVMHCFVDDAAAARRWVGLGGLVSFTGIVTFKNGQSVRDTVASLSLGQFLLETDCPFLAPAPHRGQRCEPAHVVATAQAVAAVKGCSLADLSAAAAAAADQFFHDFKTQDWRL